MNKKRIAAIVMIALILLVFLLMVIALIQGKMNLFFTEGGVLVACFILAYAFLSAIKRKTAAEEEEKKEEE